MRWKNEMERRNRVVTIRDSIGALFKHKRKILATVMLAFTAVALVTILTPTLYESKAQILIKLKSETVSASPSYAVPIIFGSRFEDINSEIEVAKSTALLEKVVSELEKSSIVDLGGEPRGFNDYLRKMERQLYVNRIKDTDIVEVRYRDHEKDVVTPILETFVRCYLDRRLELREVPGAEKYLHAQVKELNEELAEVEGALKEEEKRHKLYEYSRQKESLIDQVVELRKSLHASQLRLNETRSQMTIVETLLAETPRYIRQSMESLPNVEHAWWSEQLRELEMEKSTLVQQFHGNSRTIKDLETEIATIQGKLQGLDDTVVGRVTEGLNPDYQLLSSDLLTAKSDLRLLESRIQHSTEQLDQLYGKIDRMVDKEIVINRLERRKQNLEEILTIYMKKYEETKIFNVSEMDKIASASVIQPPLPAEPVKSRLGLKLSIALISSLLCGVILALALETMDHRLKDGEDVEIYLEKPVLAVIPEMVSGEVHRSLSGNSAP